MVKTSKGSVVLAVLASIITFATYFLLTSVIASVDVQNALNEIASTSPAAAEMAKTALNNICTTFLVLGIVTLVLGVLASFFKVANVLLNILAWFYFFYGIIVLCFFQWWFCCAAVSKNKKYFKKKAIVNSGHEHTEDEDAVAEEKDVDTIDGDADEENADNESADKAEVAKPKKKNIFNNNYSVVLKDADAANPKVIKALKKITRFSKKEVRGFLERMPISVQINVSKKEAKKAAKKLRKLGCEVEMV